MRAFPLAQLLAVPLQSAVRAHAMAGQEALRVLMDFGLQDGKARTFRMSADRVVEEQVLDPETGKFETKFVTRPFEVTVPLLALISPPSSQLQDMTVDLAVDVLQPRADPMEPVARALPGTPSLAGSLARYTPLSGDPATTMRVSMRIVQTAPEGVARLDDVLVDLLSGRPAVDEGAREVPPIERLRGVGPGIGGLFRARGILTVADLVRAARRPESVSELAQIIGVSLERMAAWVEESRRLLEQTRTRPQGGLDG
jgi:hypothetical protein